MAHPARKPDPAAPPVDPEAVARAYRAQRARRRAREQRQRERRLANLRFWFVVVGLLALSVYLVLTIWSEVETLFGL